MTAWFPLFVSGPLTDPLPLKLVGITRTAYLKVPDALHCSCRFVNFLLATIQHCILTQKVSFGLVLVPTMCLAGEKALLKMLLDLVGVSQVTQDPEGPQERIK